MRIKLIISLCLIAFRTFAQDEPIYSHYMFNSISFNPAFAGNKDNLQIQSTYRMQWIGLNGAPKTLQMNIDAPVYKKVSAGLDITQDRIGDFSTTKIYGSYAYRFSINSTSRISLGLATGLEMRKLIKDNANPSSDPVYNNINFDLNTFDLRAGLYFSNKDFYMGISSTSILPKANYLNAKINPYRNYYVTAGYLMKVSDNMVLYPSILYKDDFNKNSSFNFTGMLGLKSTLWAGVSYKSGYSLFSKVDSKYANTTSNVIGVLFDVELNDQYRIGYNFDYSLSALNQIENGSHEFSLSYYFQSKKSNRMLNPRYL